MEEASVTGLFRMILILIGAFVLLRFLGQFFMAKNNIANQNDMKRREEDLANEKAKANRNAGKIKILHEKQGRGGHEQIIDVDYTDVKES
jgi:hypothetical protein